MLRFLMVKFELSNTHLQSWFYFFRNFEPFQKGKILV